MNPTEVVEGAITCGATYSSCRCVAEPHGSDAPHRCHDGCGGSWTYDEQGEFVVVTYPQPKPWPDLIPEFSIARGGIQFPPPDNERTVEQKTTTVAPASGGYIAPSPFSSFMFGHTPTAEEIAAAANEPDPPEWDACPHCGRSGMG